LDKLSQDYLKRAKIRLEVLEVFYNNKERRLRRRGQEAQEVVELGIKSGLKKYWYRCPENTRCE